MEDLGGRARRALALMGVALVALAVAAGVYLRVTAAGPRPPPPPPALSSLDWLSPEVGWAVLTGDQASVLFHTVDGGRHWQRQFATVATATSVRFLDPLHGLMTEETSFPSSNPTLLRSDDGGAHWAPIPLPDSTGPRPTLSAFLDLDHGWLMVRTGRSDTAEDAVIYRTADGGRDWSVVASVDPVTLRSHGLTEEGLKRWLSFRTDQDGYLGTLEPDGSASVSVTHDGGSNWRRVPLPEPPGGWGPGDTLTLLPPSVSDDGDGALLLVDTTRAARQAGTRTPRRTLRGPVLPAVIVYHTRDGGETWEDPTPAPLGADPTLTAPAFVSGAAGWLTSGRSLWVTSDSGRTWDERTPPPAGRSLLSLAPIDGTVAVGQAATGAGRRPAWVLLVTEDAGRTWRNLPAPPPPR